MTATKTPQELLAHVEKLKSTVCLTLDSIKASHHDDLTRVRQVLKRAGCEPSPPKAATPATATVPSNVATAALTDHLLATDNARRVRELSAALKSANRGPTVATDSELTKAKEAVDHARKLRSPEEVEKGLHNMQERMRDLFNAKPASPRPALLERPAHAAAASQRHDLFSVSRGPVLEADGSQSGSTSSPGEGGRSVQSSTMRLVELAMAEGISSSGALGRESSELDWANVRRSLQSITQLRQASQSPPPVASPVEVTAAAASVPSALTFSELDSNCDGVIDKTEWEAAQQQQQQVQEQQSVSPEALPSGGPNTLQERLHQYRAKRSSELDKLEQEAADYLLGAGRFADPNSAHNRLARLRGSLN